MPATISTIAMQEKNKIATTSVFFTAIEITIPSLTETVKIHDADENITWKGSTWQPFPVQIDEIIEKIGEVPRLNLKVSNVNRVFEKYLQDYDLYCKTNGYQAITINLYVLNSLNLADDTPEAEYEFNLEQPKTNAEWAIFQLGASNPFLRRFPLNRILKNQCRFIFKSSQCGYTGSMTNCNKTLTRCRELSNSSRFGGFAGVGSGGLRLANE